MKRRTSPIWQMEAEAFRALIARSQTLTEVLAHFGLPNRGSNYRTLMQRIREEAVDIAHIRSAPFRLRGAMRPLAEILVPGRAEAMHGLKSRLLKAELLAERCCRCGLGPEWQGERLILQLDHINGDRCDNRLENLRLLCPNCHSQTENFAGRKNAADRIPRPMGMCGRCGQAKPTVATGLCHACRNVTRRKVERPPTEILRDQVEKLGYTGTGRLYGVSDNAIRKWLT